MNRIELLRLAGKLNHAAINYSHSGAKFTGTRRWSQFYDPRADEGVHILDEALTYPGEVGDWSGEIQATRACLLAQRGLPELALSEAQKVESLREADPITYYHASKLYAINRNTTEAVRRFEKAIHAGFKNLELAGLDGFMPS